MNRTEFMSKIALMDDAEFTGLISLYKNGGVTQDAPKSKIPDTKPATWEEIAKLFPEDELNDSTYNLKRAVELAPWDSIKAHLEDPNTHHLKDFYWNEAGDVGEFMKRKDYPHLRDWDGGDPSKPGGEIGWYLNSPDAEEFRKEWFLDESGDFPKYIKRVHKSVNIHKDGGSITDQLKSQLGESELTDLLEMFGIDDLLKGGEKTTKNMSIQIIIEGSQEEDDGGHKAPELTTVEVGSKKYEVETVSTKADMAKGLSERKELDADKGMLFDFNSVQEEVQFNVAEMQFPIDIIFINDDDEVIKVAKDCQPGKDIFTCNDVRYVLEVNANSGIKVGDDFDNDPNSTDSPVMKVLAPDGSTQMELHGGERIFSRVASRRFIHWAKRCEASKKDSDYKHLGELMFKEIAAQDNRPPEYVEVPDN